MWIGGWEAYRKEAELVLYRVYTQCTFFCLFKTHFLYNRTRPATVHPLSVHYVCSLYHFHLLCLFSLFLYRQLGSNLSGSADWRKRNWLSPISVQHSFPSSTRQIPDLGSLPIVSNWLLPMQLRLCHTQYFTLWGVLAEKEGCYDAHLKDIRAPYLHFRCRVINLPAPA